ncbi:MAG: glycosyltransferase family 2 protein [Chloracidobacterium sp.]|nr:glycosyltransferase family 2 protein [Chloracidobacterium sp.]MDW8218269.1 glycosyltransferase family 2 protein [Acidobacteriota bacterium]
MLETLFQSVAALTAVALAVSVVALGRGNRAIRFLVDAVGSDASTDVFVSVIVAARNEADTIEPALRSLAAQDHPALEIIVVNDRSTDATSDVLARLQQEYPSLKVITVPELPPGWLGKNHAHWIGAQAAQGEFLLFTDADIVMHPSAVRRATAFAVAERLDHLAMGPEVHMPGALLTAFLGTFTMCFAMFIRPWRARDPRSPAFVGVGAFNLVRRAAYERAGTHAAIRMRPDDDIKLGKIIKRAGGRQELVAGKHLLSVVWYRSVGELIRGLEKNAFAGMDYNLALAAVGPLTLFVLFVWPYLALALTTGWLWWLNLLNAALGLVLYADNSLRHGVKWRHVPLFPVTVVLLIFIVWNAVLRTLVRRGITWRGTHYPLAELKANRV